MKKFKSISFMEKGYGHFPYLIIRIRAGLYQQIPIHRTGIENELLEGLFINCDEIIDTNHYKLACKEVLERYWQEQKDKGNVHYVGNTMIDSLVQFEPVFKNSEILNDLNIKPQEYFVFTFHRPGNVDNIEKLTELVSVIKDIAQKGSRPA